MAQSKKPIPNMANYSITDEDVKNAGKQKRYRDGWYQALVTRADSQVSDSKDSLMTVLTLAPLATPGDPETAEKTTVKHWLVYPLKNPDVKGHKAPNTAGMTGSALRAMGIGDIPRGYRFDKEIKGHVDDEGDRVSKEEVEERKMEVSRAILEASLQCFQDSSMFDGSAPYVKLKQDGDFTRVDRFAEELPEGETLVNPEDFFTEATDDTSDEDAALDEVEEEEAPPPPPTPAAKKPAAKKAAPAKKKR